MKKYLITGGSSGIGASVLENLVENAIIYNIDINKPLTQHINHNFIQTDLSDYRNISKIVPTHINFDGIFLNAGIHKSNNIFNHTLDEIENVMATNVMSNIAILKSLENSINNGSSIVLNGSDQCFIAKPNSFAYAVSKGAISQMTKSLALDLASRNIRVNAVCPSTTDTKLYRDSIKEYSKISGISLDVIEHEEANCIPLKRIATAQEVANVVLFLLSDKSTFMTGGLVPVDGGFIAQ